MTSIFAAAGIAEAAWVMAAFEIMLASGIVGVVALFATASRSPNLSLAATGLMLLVALFYQPWYCFRPFEESTYADPDVQSAAVMFRNVGVIWIVTCVMTLSSLLIAFLARRTVPLSATPDAPEERVTAAP